MAKKTSGKRKKTRRKSSRTSRKRRKNSRGSRKTRTRAHSTYISPRACSPLRKSTFRASDFNTCYTLEALKTIRGAYNKTAPSKDKIPVRKTKKGLWNAIKEKIDQMNPKEGCEGEWCWVKQPFMRNVTDPELKLLTFKPPIPKGKYDWLSTDDIDRVMKQYTKMHPDLYFMGTWPMDFEKLHKKFRTFDPQKIQSKGKKTVALVLNEDNSTQPGSHWVGLFINLPNRQVHFFDSYGKKPLPPVCKWLTNVNNRIKRAKGNKGNPLTVLWNPHRHQYANSECGVYTINFIIKRLEGKSFKSIVNNQIKDEEMNKRRSTFFNPFDKYDNTIYG